MKIYIFCIVKNSIFDTIKMFRRNVKSQFHLGVDMVLLNNFIYQNLIENIVPLPQNEIEIYIETNE